MTLDEAMEWAIESDASWSSIDEAAIVLAAEVRRLQSVSGRCSDCSLGHMAERIAHLAVENTALRLYAPARRAKPTVKTAPIAPTNWPAWGMIDETDEEFAERAGRKVTEVAE